MRSQTIAPGKWEGGAALQPPIPHLTRSALHRCLQRHGISRRPDVEGDRLKRQRFECYPIGFFHMDIAEVDSDEQLRIHLADVIDAYNFARRPKMLGGVTPYEYICKIRTSEPDRFIVNPIHQVPA